MAVPVATVAAMDEAGLTPEWFSEVFGRPVTAVGRRRIGEGLVGLNVRCALTSPDPAVAASVVVKLPSPDATSRATGIALRNYEREVRFYTEVASTVRIRVPHCHHGSWDPGTGEFVLVLEDMAPAEVGDQIVGCAPAQAEVALVELARLHAPRWGDPTLYDLDWVSRRDEAGMAGVVALYRQFWPGFVARFGHHLTGLERRLGERLGESLPSWLAQRPEPLTITHGDYRLDNLLFATAAGGPPVTAVDWQTPGHGPGVADASYFLGAGLLIDDRRRYERDLVARYHQALGAEGVAGLSGEDTWDQYRLFAFAGVVMTVVASMIVGATERGDAMFGAMAERHFAHAEDLAAADFLS
jgi:hypothetical protein